MSYDPPLPTTLDQAIDDFEEAIRLNGDSYEEMRRRLKNFVETNYIAKLKGEIRDAQRSN